MTRTTRTCSMCGATLDAERTGGVCAACLLLGAVEVADPKPGSLGRIADYELLEVIARGGMGIVYRARQTRPDREVALKALPGAAVLSDEARQRFRIEAQAMARLEHPHILPIHALGEEDGTPFFSMKLAAGGTLARRIGDYAGQWRQIAELIATVARAAHFAHERGVLHRDLKPGNILFDEHGGIFVSDFGLAKVIDEEPDLTRTIELMGTPNYMAPELLRGGKGAATTASDVWSLGVILYELLTGQPPFRGENFATVLRQIAEEEPPPLHRRPGIPPAGAGIPRDLVLITRKALQKDPARRYASARDLADDLHRWLRGEPIYAQPIPLAARVSLWAKRKPALAALSGALALVLFAGGLLLLRANRSLMSAVASAREQRARAESGLRDSLIAQSSLVRQSLQIGQRFNALDLIRRAVAASGPGIELRHEAAAALAEPDVALVGEVSRFEHVAKSGRSVAVTPDFRFILGVGPDDPAVRLRELATGRTAWQPATKRGPPPGEFRLSASGRYAALIFGDQWLEVWDTSGNRLLHSAQLLPQEKQSRFKPLFRPFDLHDTLPLIAGVDAAGTVWMHDLVTGRHTEVLTGRTRVAAVLIDDAGDALAIAADTAVELWDVARKRRKWSLPMRDAGDLLDWSGTTFIASDPGTRSALVITGSARATRFHSPNGDIMAGRFMPRTTQVLLLDSTGRLASWDVRDGRVLWEMQAGEGCLAAHESGDAFLVEYKPGRLMKWQRAPDRVFAEFHYPGNASSFATSGELQVSPDGRLIATRANTAAFLWDTRMRRFLHIQRLGDSTTLGITTAFAPDSSAWFVSRRAGPGVYRLSLEWADDATVRLGEPAAVPGLEDKWLECISDDGNTWMIWDADGRLHFWRPDGTPAAGWAKETPMTGLRPSPKLRYLFSPHISWPQKVVILDASTGQPCGEYAAAAHTATFSPGEQWLVVHESSAYRFLETGTWQQHAAVPCRIGAGQFGVAAVSLDGTLAAVEQERDVIDLVALPTGQLLVKLTPPQTIGARGMTFSPDGTRLYVIGQRHRLFEWNLQALREELAKLGLAW